jgi:hypothetical protein
MIRDSELRPVALQASGEPLTVRLKRVPRERTKSVEGRVRSSKPGVVNSVAPTEEPPPSRACSTLWSPSTRPNFPEQRDLGRATRAPPAQTKRFHPRRESVRRRCASFYGRTFGAKFRLPGIAALLSPLELYSVVRLPKQRNLESQAAKSAGRWDASLD